MALSNGLQTIKTNNLSTGASPSPQRCSICHKRMYFKAYKCKHCRHRCHKKCAAIGSSSRRNSAHKAHTGEEHWSKVLQANEVNSNLIGWHCGGRHQCHHGCSCDSSGGGGGGGGKVTSKHGSRKSSGGSRKASRGGEGRLGKDSTSNNIFTSLYSRFCDWVASTKKDSAGLLGRRGHDPAARSASTGASSGSGGCPTIRTTAVPDGSLVSFVPGTPDGGGLHRGYHTSVSSEDSELSSFYMTSYSSTCSNLTLTSTSTATSDCYRLYDSGWNASTSASPSLSRNDVMVTPVSNSRCSCHRTMAHQVVKDKMNNVLLAGGASPVSDYFHYYHGTRDTPAGTSTPGCTSLCVHTSSGVSLPSDQGTTSSITYDDDDDDDVISEDNDDNVISVIKPHNIKLAGNKKLLQYTNNKGQNNNKATGQNNNNSISPKGTRSATSRRLQFGRTKHPSVSAWSHSHGLGGTDKDNRAFLCATWPPSNRRKLSYDESTTSEKSSDLNESVFASDDEQPDFDTENIANIKELLGDCSISFADLEFGDCVRQGRSHAIHRGRWHGDVMIHTYNNLSDEEETEFWSEVSKLSMIRHENIALFMGACLDSPNFAVVTSVVKGKSLYEQIHLKSDKLNANVRMAICRQVAQGMGYLHARGIVIRHLNSKNVYLEPKVKLSIMDYGMAEKRHDRTAYGCIPRGNLCYIAPEMMRTLRVLFPGLEPTAPSTKAADVYAFGTILYETMTGQFPFSKMPAEVIIWQIGRGKRQSLKNVKVNNTLRRLIEKCWSRNPESRWTFAEINKEIQFNTVLHKRHSSSNPEKLNRAGLNDQNTCIFP